MSKANRFERSEGATLAARLAEPRRCTQVVAGPRQLGKTTLVNQVLARANLPHRYASADDTALRGAGWLEAQWGDARALATASALALAAGRKGSHTGARGARFSCSTKCKCFPAGPRP